MNRTALFACSALVFALLALIPSPARAGVWIVAWGSDTLSTHPLRILDRFKMFDRFTTTFCAAEIAPISFLGSAQVPILGWEAPPGLSCELDTSGVATFSAAPCVNTFGWTFGDASLGVIVDSPTACFAARMITEIGPFDDVNDICYPIAPTPVLSETWGRLRATYR
jgi:hypothetical protein